MTQTFMMPPKPTAPAKVVPISRPRDRAELASIEADIETAISFMVDNGMGPLRMMTVCKSILEHRKHQKAELFRAMDEDPGICDCLPCQMKRHLGDMI